MRVNQMTLVEHIAELRKRLLIVALSFTVFFIAGFFWQNLSLCIFKKPMK